jgi:hypothetical protein
MTQKSVSEDGEIMKKRKQFKMQKYNFKNVIPSLSTKVINVPVNQALGQLLR